MLVRASRGFHYRFLHGHGMLLRVSERGEGRWDRVLANERRGKKRAERFADDFHLFLSFYFINFWWIFMYERPPRVNEIHGTRYMPRITEPAVTSRGNRVVFPRKRLLLRSPPSAKDLLRTRRKEALVPAVGLFKGKPWNTSGQNVWIQIARWCTRMQYIRTYIKYTYLFSAKRFIYKDVRVWWTYVGGIEVKRMFYGFRIIFYTRYFFQINIVEKQ